MRHQQRVLDAQVILGPYCHGNPQPVLIKDGWGVGALTGYEFIMAYMYIMIVW